jgi:HEAT repeat protein
LSNEDASVRITAAETLVRVGQTSPDEAVEALRKALGNDNETLWYQPMMSLADELRQASSETSEALLLKEVRRAETWSRRRDYADLLGQIGRYSEQVVDVLLLGLTDDDTIYVLPALKHWQDLDSGTVLRLRKL